jgi:hypothetical protein
VERADKVITVGGLRLGVSRFGALTVGHRVLEPEEIDKVIEVLQDLASQAREIRAEKRRPVTRPGL